MNEKQIVFVLQGVAHTVENDILMYDLDLLENEGKCPFCSYEIVPANKICPDCGIDWTDNLIQLTDQIKKLRLAELHLERQDYCPNCNSTLVATRVTPEGHEIYQSVECSGECGYRAVESFELSGVTVDQLPE